MNNIRKHVMLVENAGLLHQAYSKLDLSTYDAFIGSFKALNKSQKELGSAIIEEQKRIQNKLKEEYIASKVGNNYIKVYHGTGIDKYHKIMAKGFELTKGERAGFMGAGKFVQNQGIFLTDSQSIAHYFGDNRSPSDYDVIESFIPDSPFLDMTKVPPKIKKVAKELLMGWNNESRINQSNAWELLDSAEFVDVVKSMGYIGACFKETIAIRREAKDLNALTYLLFDTNKIVIVKNVKSNFGTEEFYQHIKEVMGNS